MTMVTVSYVDYACFVKIKHVNKLVKKSCGS